jgi:hypothetical protein
VDEQERKQAISLLEADKYLESFTFANIHPIQPLECQSIIRVHAAQLEQRNHGLSITAMCYFVAFAPVRRKIHVVGLILAKKAMSDLSPCFAANNSEWLSQKRT